MPEKDSGREWLKTAMIIGTMGLDMIVFAFGGFWLGRWADEWLGTGFWCTAGGVLLGFVLGLWAVYRQASRV